MSRRRARYGIVAQSVEKRICLVRNIVIDLRGITHPSLLQDTSLIRGSCQAKTNVSGRSFIRPSKGAMVIRNAFKANFNGPSAAILSQTQQVYMRCVFSLAPHNGTFIKYKVYDKKILVTTITILIKNVVLLQMYVYNQVVKYFISVIILVETYNI